VLKFSNMETIKQFNTILDSYKIQAACIDYKQIDNYFFYDLKLSPNAKVKDISKFSDEISLALKTPCKPNIKILHNLGVVRLEFVTLRGSTLNLFDYFTNEDIIKSDIPCLLGQRVDGKRVWMDLAQNPHMIVAGTTGSGKSTLIHNIIANLFTYNNVKLFLSDPKSIEFSAYESLTERDINISYTYKDTLDVTDSLLNIMDTRYQYIRDGLDPNDLTKIVFIIDEFADLIMQDKNDEFYTKICRLAQKCRAAKIHIILATQRPSVNIINGTIKANFPARIACRVASQVDSKLILDTGGAENLLGYGDALLRDNFRNLERFQVAYTSAEEVCRVFA
jgi:S-DNA-T family DNA segregation ATPase FtsK/SpoIIIE